ncbi:hypothetical protein CKO28_13470, partial [Rhodovibrio sodomensis]
MCIRKLLYALMASTCLIVPAKAATITVDTDAGTINGVASGGSFNGTPFTTQVIGNVMRFQFAGDLTIDDDDRVVGTGSRGASFFAGNNANIGARVTFDFSAIGATPGAGGGSGGTAGAAA